MYLKNIVYSLFFKKNGDRQSSFGAIGEETIVNPNSRLVPKNMFLENNVIIQGGVNFISFNGKLIVKKFSVISSDCIIVPSRHLPAVGVPFYYATKYHLGDEDATITIEEDCWIGAGCILLPGITIRRGSIIGAGSVVTKDTLPYSVMVGCPARLKAVKFSLTDIITHETLLYKETERLSLSYLQSLFDSSYNSLPVTRKSIISDADNVFLVNKER